MTEKKLTDEQIIEMWKKGEIQPTIKFEDEHLIISFDDREFEFVKLQIKRHK